MKWKVHSNSDEFVIKKGKLIVCVPIDSEHNNKQTAYREQLANHVCRLLNSACYVPFGPTATKSTLMVSRGIKDPTFEAETDSAMVGHEEDD